MIAIDLSQRTALITGAAKGIGAAVARRLADAGAKVILVDRPQPENARLATELAAEIKRSGGEALALGARVDVWEEIQRGTHQAVERFGRIDLLVTSAGTTSRFGVQELEPNEWSRILAINLTGSYNSVKAVLPSMLEQRRGAIVLVGSAAIVAGSGGGVHYAAAKAGLEGLCRGLTR